MNLLKVLSSIEEYTDEETIYAVKPWTINSDIIVMVEPDESELELRANGQIYSYFLETFLVKDLLNDLRHLNGNAKLSPEEIAIRVIQYASNDA